MLRTGGMARWLLLSTVGLALGIPGGLALGAPFEFLVGAMLITPLMLGLTGLLMGAFQSVALKGRVAAPWKWVGLTATGSAIALTAGVVLVEQGGAWLAGQPVRLATTGAAGLAGSLLVIGVVGGAGIGLAQSMAVRQIKGAIRDWVLSSTAGLTVGFLTAMPIAMIAGGFGTPWGLALFLTVSGLVYSVATGRALRRIAAAI